MKPEFVFLVPKENGGWPVTAFLICDKANPLAGGYSVNRTGSITGGEGMTYKSYNTKEHKEISFEEALTCIDRCYDPTTFGKTVREILKKVGLNVVNGLKIKGNDLLITPDGGISYGCTTFTADEVKSVFDLWQKVTQENK